MSQRSGSLTIVGTGIMLAGHCTREARAAIEQADIVFSLMGDEHHQAWIEQLNPQVERLDSLYATQSDRPSAYAAMVSRLLAEVREGRDVCAAFYGHPGVYVTPSHAAIMAARAEGFFACMLPGVSAEACLFSDLGLDPGRFGCQSYEARDFMLNARTWDTRAALLLWQIAVIGDASFRRFDPCPGALAALTDVLAEAYGLDHMVTIYEAARVATEDPHVVHTRLRDLAAAQVSQGSTLYVPPSSVARPCTHRMALLEHHLGTGP